MLETCGPAGPTMIEIPPPGEGHLWAERAESGTDIVTVWVGEIGGMTRLSGPKYYVRPLRISGHASAAGPRPGSELGREVAHVAQAVGRVFGRQ